ncbi:CsgE family curli-type amyloid fiber assembly protein [uncultured Fibrella sp.]|uniref:CsgE family curli-type amyloid fiber assembly protein n=1 Tax=uncultured Fibrella sp. TaxID=1284596 RepID=UPI0035CB066D
MKTILALLLSLLSALAIAQDPASGNDLDLDDKLVECPVDDNGGNSLILDNTRTKVGKDFYDLFYKYWTTRTPPADSSKQYADTLMAVDVVIVVEEIPSPGTASQIMISIDDQPVWQQFVQARYELLEEDALYALEVVREYLTTYLETQQQLGNKDQKGSGVH